MLRLIILRKQILKKLKVGYLKTLFDATYSTKANDEKTLEVIKSLGVELIPVELPTDIPYPLCE